MTRGGFGDYCYVRLNMVLSVKDIAKVTYVEDLLEGEWENITQ